MKAHHLSASKVDLALCCSWWARPDTEQQDRPPGEKAARGTVVHKASDCFQKGLALPAMDEEAAALWISLRAWEERVEPFTHSEIPLLYDAENDTTTPCQMGESERDYLGVTPMHIPMRLDLVRADGDGVRVVDIKTGSKANSAPPHENLQLATQAVAAARHFGVDRVSVGLVHPMKTKVHEPEWFELDADALDAHAGKLYRVLRTLPLAEPNRGSWCFRCPIGPAKGFVTKCPAWQIEGVPE